MIFQVKKHQTYVKQAINDQAEKDGLQNNLATKSSGRQDDDGGTDDESSEVSLPSTSFGPDTASKPGEKIRYPLLMKDDQDMILFKSEGGGQVALGIQPAIQDSNRQNWGDSTLGPIKKAALNAAKGLIGADDYTAKAGEELTKGMDAFRKASGDPTMKGAAQTWFAAQALSMDPNQLLARSDVGMGMIMNPNLELVYGGPTLRTFSYTFKMTPRGRDEADACRANYKLL